MMRAKQFFTLNPIVVKEIRSRMRGPRAFITLTVILLVLGGMMYATLQIILASASYSNVLSPQIGQNLFAVLVFMELFMICAVTPAVTSGAISGEKEKQTYEMLMATPLSAASILWGKLVSALSYVMLLLFAGIPLASVVFIFGGVSPREMVKALLILIVVAVTLGVLGLFMSALFGRTGRATIASFVVVALLMFGPLFFAILLSALRKGEPPRLVLAPSPISALSSALAPSTSGPMGGSEIFYILGGIFNMGVSQISFNSIPRPIYHYSLPLYIFLSLILYLLAMRLIQPTRRWHMMRREMLVGLIAILVLLGVVVGGFLLSADRYERAGSGQNLAPTMAPVMPMAVPGIAEERVVIQPDGKPVPIETATPLPLLSVPGLETSDLVGIYAAVARQFYTVDHTFGDKPPAWQSFYLVAQTDDSVGDPNAQKGNPTELPNEVISGVTEQLSDLPTNVLWVKAGEYVPISGEGGMVDNGRGARVTFGNIYPQEDGTVQVSASLYFSNLGGSGKTYILEKKDGVWQITGSTGVEWIS